MADPAIIVVSEHHADLLLGEFRSRYQRDYDLRPATTAAQAEDLAREIGGAGGQVAMFVTDSRLPDVDHIFAAIHRWRVVVPTARRVIAAHWDHFLEDGPGLRIGMAKGKYDAYLLMPRGRRDEEFHHAITDLLSDWTSTVPQPEVVTAKIISPARDSLTMAIRDFLDRMGMQNRVWHPDAPELQDYLSGIRRQLGVDDLRWPLVVAANRVPIQATSVRDVAIAINGRPSDFDIDETVDLAVVGGGPAGLAAAVYARLRRTLGRRPGRRGDRRPGRYQLDDPQLPRLPARHLRHAAGAACPQPGAPLRHPVLHRLGGHRPGARRGRRPPRAAHRRRRPPGPERPRRERRHLPQARRTHPRGPGRLRRQLRRRPDRSAGDGGPGRRRGGRRQLRRAGRVAPGPVRAHGDDRGPPAEDRGDDVAVPRRRDRLQRADRGADLHARHRRRRRRPAGVAGARGHHHG